MTTMPHGITDIFLKKSAIDAGLEIPADEREAPGWYQCGSSRFSLKVWLRITSHGAEIALSKQDVLEKLWREIPDMPKTADVVKRSDLPEGTNGILLALSPDKLHALLARIVQLELSLPHRLAEAFTAETTHLPKSTEAERLVVQRIGQDKLRRGLLEYWRGECAVTGLALTEVLRASHIKPWRACDTNHERLNIYNALLLAPHLDALFDCGLITFAAEGIIRLSPQLTPVHCGQLALSDKMAISRVDEAHLPFLQYHRDSIFRGQSG